MKVGELIDLLEQFDAEASVHFAYNYGDYWRTQVAPEVNEIEEGHVVHSHYHDIPKVVERYDEDGEDVPLKDELPTVVILK